MTAAELDAELERHHPESFGWARSCCRGNRSEAEDVLQASYLKVLDGRARFDGRSSFKTWLFGVIRLTAAEERRSRLLRRWWQARPSGPASDPVDPAPDPATALERSDTAYRLRAALARLAERQRAVLHLVFYQDLSIQEAAVVLGIAVGTARVHYERGKRRLRRLLGIAEEHP